MKRCCVACGGRYQQLLSDCHQCYFQQRLTLLSASVSSAINDLVSRHSRDHCALVSDQVFSRVIAACSSIIVGRVTVMYCVTCLEPVGLGCFSWLNSVDS